MVKYNRMAQEQLLRLFRTEANTQRSETGGGETENSWESGSPQLEGKGPSVNPREKHVDFEIVIPTTGYNLWMLQMSLYACSQINKSCCGVDGISSPLL